MTGKGGFRILWLMREINVSLKRYGNRKICRREGNATYAQRLILEYLISRGDEKICASDIRAALDMPKASLSDNLRALRKKGYLYMETSQEDERRKWIVPANETGELREWVGESLEEVQVRLCRGIPQSDQEVLERSLARVLENLREENKRRTNV